MSMSWQRYVYKKWPWCNNPPPHTHTHIHLNSEFWNKCQHQIVPSIVVTTGIKPWSKLPVHLCTDKRIDLVLSNLLFHTSVDTLVTGRVLKCCQCSSWWNYNCAIEVWQGIVPTKNVIPASGYLVTSRLFSIFLFKVICTYLKHICSPLMLNTMSPACVR